MNQYQSTNTLVTSTDVPMSGTGTATPEGGTPNADYTGWSWEVMLATVLGIGAPDRGEVTGQPWLAVQANGPGAAGWHLIWSAGWDTSPDGGGASSIQVYLNPALYTDGGAWDSYLTAPATALAGVPTQDYGGLPLSPPTFQSASVAVTGVTTFLASAVHEFGALHTEAASGPAAEFQGDVATVVSELLGDLRRALAAVHDQMTTPESYGASISTAGDAAGQFLTDLMSAYLAWTQVPAHSPLGAVVQVLEGIATPDGNGAYVIPDPRNTPFGDLTDPGAWPAVEQQAKNLWTGLLAGESPDFAGLDPQGRIALGKLTSQLAATSATVVPVVGPGMPARQQAPDSPVTGQGATGAPPSARPAAQTAGPGAAGGPAASGPQANTGAGPALGAGVGPGATPVPAGAPLVPLALLGTGTTAGPTGTGADTGLTDLATPAGSASAPGPDAVPGSASDLAVVPGAGLVTGLAVQGGTVAAGAENAAADTTPGTADLSSLAGGLAQPSALAGAIGAIADDRASNAAPPQPHRDGFTGTIGHAPETGDKAGGPLRHGGQHDGGRKKALSAALRQAPTAGFSLGRDPGGTVLPQATVPTVAARPTAVVSSPVNSQLIPGAGALGSPDPGGTAAALPSGAGSLGGPTAMLPPGGTAVGAPVGSVSSAGPGALAAPADALGEQAMLGRGAMGEAGPGGLAGGPMMPSAGRPGGGAGSQERTRRAYLPEERESWGTGPGPADAALGSGEDAEPEFEPMPSAAVGIGAVSDQGRAAEEVEDWRMP